MTPDAVARGPWLPRVVRVVGAALIVVACVVGYCTTDDPALKHTSALNTLFDSRLPVAVARVVALVGLGYLLASIVVKASRDQWISRAGPLDVDPAQALADDQDTLQDQLDAAQVTIRDLEHRLSDYVDDGSQTAASIVESPLPRVDTSAEE